MNKIQVLPTLLAFLLSGCGLNEEEYVKSHDSGVADAASIDQATCLERSILKSKSCTSIECSVNTNGYFLGCFKNASKSPDVCVNVPIWDGAFTDEKWRSEQCTINSADPVRCDILFASLQRECH
jgi:hypothetical protein